MVATAAEEMSATVNEIDQNRSKAKLGKITEVINEINDGNLE